MFLRSLFIGLVFSVSLVFAGDGSATQSTVAISLFQGDGFEEVELKLITSRFREGLLQAGRFQLLEKKQVEALDQEKGMAQAGCFASSCFAELGMNLGVQNMVFGTVSRVGNLLSAEVRLVEVKGGKILKSALIDSDRDFTKFVQLDILDLAEKLSGSSVDSRSSFEFSPDSTRSPVAVLEVDANGVDSLVARGLTRRLGVELFNTGKFEVMERDEMAEILKEQAFQQTMCEDDDCAVKMGQLVGVEFMVGGSVTRIGDLYSVSSRLIDVATGRILRTSTVDVEGDLETVLKETMNDVARSLSGLDLRRRFNTAAWSWLGAGALLAGLGGWQHLDALDKNKAYNAEREDLDRLLELKDQAWSRYVTAGSLYAASLIASGVSTWYFLRSEKKIKVRNMEAVVEVLPGAVSLRLDF